MIRKVLMLSAVALAVACGPGPSTTDAGSGGGSITGGGGAGGGGGGGSSGSIAQVNAYCNAISDKICTNFVSCNLMESNFKTQCVSIFGDSFCSDLRNSVSGGQASYDGTKSDQCVQAIQSAPAGNCDNPFGNVFSGSACSGLSVGLVPNGGRCDTSGDCAASSCSHAADAGSICNGVCGGPGGGTGTGNGYLGNPCYGTTVGSCYSPNWCDVSANLCKAPQGTGGNCTSSGSRECDSNNYCNTTTGKCAALPGPGTACNTSTYPYCNAASYCSYSTSPPMCVVKGPQGASCTQFSVPCEDSLRCVNSTCQPPVGSGGACQNYNDCVQGLSCDDVSRTCRQSSSVGPGEACSSTRYCTDSYCAGKTTSSDGGVGTAGSCSTNYVGQKCSGHYGCGKGTYCLKAADAGFNDGVCQTSSNGSACDRNDNCPTSSYCGTGTCRPRVGPGGTCQVGSSNGCSTSGNQCIGTAADAGTGTCGVPGSTGATCVVGVSGACKIPNDCIGGTCTLVGQNGQPCAQNATCYDGACTGANPTTGARGTCGAARADNQPCSSDFDCLSKFCDTVRGACSSVCQ